MHTGTVVTTRGVALALAPSEARVLGCLLEKQRTTPDAYPLSLNSLRLACNQSTNRDPVVDYDEDTVREALRRLERAGLVRLASGAGSRASKYRHMLAEALPLSRSEEAILCVLLLRGAQTPGELKQRGERISRFESLEELGAVLEQMIERGLVERLPRRPGQKEERYKHLLGADDGEAPASGMTNGLAGEVASEMPISSGGAVPEPVSRAGDALSGADVAPDAAHGDGSGTLAGRVAELEREVASLREAVRELRGTAGRL